MRVFDQEIPMRSRIREGFEEFRISHNDSLGAEQAKRQANSSVFTRLGKDFSGPPAAPPIKLPSQ